MVRFRAQDMWDCAAQGDVLRLQQHVRSRVSLRRTQAGAGVDERCPWTGLSALHFACANGRLAAAKLLLEAGADPCAASLDDFGKSPLHLACENGRVRVARFLLTLFDRADQLPVDASGNSVVHSACASGKLGLVQHFFDRFGAESLSNLVEPGEYDERIDDFLDSSLQAVPAQSRRLA